MEVMSISIDRQLQVIKLLRTLIIFSFVVLVIFRTFSRTSFRYYHGGETLDKLLHMLDERIYFIAILGKSFR